MRDPIVCHVTLHAIFLPNTTHPNEQRLSFSEILYDYMRYPMVSDSPSTLHMLVLSWNQQRSHLMRKCPSSSLRYVITHSLYLFNSTHSKEQRQPTTIEHPKRNQDRLLCDKRCIISISSTSALVRIARTRNTPTTTSAHRSIRIIREPLPVIYIRDSGISSTSAPATVARTTSPPIIRIVLFNPVCISRHSNVNIASQHGHRHAKHRNAIRL